VGSLVSETEKKTDGSWSQTGKSTFSAVSETEKNALPAVSESVLPSLLDSSIAALSPADKIEFERNLLSTNELYAKIADEPTVQIVKSSVKESLVITGKKGTRLILPPNVFNLPEGTPVTFTLREAYKMGDMLLENLTTQSGNRMLSSGGMVQITATVDGKSIQPNKPFTLLMPKDPNNPNPMANSMQLFTGARAPNQPLNWILNVNGGNQLLVQRDFLKWEEKSQQIKDWKRAKQLLNDTCGCNKMFVWKMESSIWNQHRKQFKKGAIDRMPERYLFSDVKPKQKGYLFHKINHPKYFKAATDSLSYLCHLIAGDNTLPKHWTWQRKIRFFPLSIRNQKFDPYRRIPNAWSNKEASLITQGYERSIRFSKMLKIIDKNIDDLSNQLTDETKTTDWATAIQTARVQADSTRRQQMEIARQTEQINKDFKAAQKRHAEGKQQTLNDFNNAKQLSHGELVFAANHYIFQSMNFGWANCDYFTHELGAILVKVKTKSLFQDIPNAKLIFKKQNIIFPPSIEANKLAFYNVKKGEEALIVALKMENNQPFLAMQPFKTDAMTLDLKYEPMTLEALKEKLKLLN
jgi:hypothetical protein